MKREFRVTVDGVDIGHATIVPAGLYYDVRCRCNVAEGVVRIVADCGDRQENIGICVPKDGAMVIHTKLAQKRLASIQGFIAFLETRDEWIPLTEGVPLPSLEQILSARFAYRNQKPGLIIPQVKPYKCL